jgi:surface antigen Omp85-like protein
MRSAAFVLLLSFGAAAISEAQDQSSDAASGLLKEPDVMRQGVDLAARWLDQSGAPAKDGFYPYVGNMITGAGWISAGPGYRKHLFNGHAVADGAAAISWRAYKVAQARFEWTDLAHDHVAVGSQVWWQDLTQVNYFGVGADSLESNRSEYRLKSTDVVGYSSVRAKDWLTIGGRFGWLRQPTLSAATGPFDGGYADTLVLFNQDPGIAQPVSFVHGDVSVAADTRDHPRYPTAGGLYRAAFAAYSDRDLSQFSFRRYEAEAAQFIPVSRSWVLAVHGWGVFSDTSSGNSVPFYMLPSLGGHDTLRGYLDYRFHDRNLLVVNAESRWALFRDVDAAVFFDAGNVAARARDLNLDKTSYGAGLRVHSRTATIGRLDVGRSRHEGWRVFFKLDDPFRFVRLSRPAAVIPFVP